MTDGDMRKDRDHSEHQNHQGTRDGDCSTVGHWKGTIFIGCILKVLSP